MALLFASGCIQEPESTYKTCADVIGELPQLISDAQSYPTAKMERIVDGDTLVLTNGQKVRLIGIDTPERGEDYYFEAGDYLFNLTYNRTLYLEKDQSEKDKYGRYLYYVYTNESFVNAEMILAGYARAYPYEPDTKYAFLFDCLEMEAKINKRIIWSKDTY